MTDFEEFDVTNIDLSDLDEKNIAAKIQENSEQRTAFELYYRLGSKRSLAEVSKQLGRTTRTLENWSSTFRWQERVSDRETKSIEHAVGVQRTFIEEELKRAHIAGLDSIIDKGVEALNKGDLKLKSIDELLKVVNARWALARVSAEEEAKASAASQHIHYHAAQKIPIDTSQMDKSQKLDVIKKMLEGIQKLTNRKPLKDRV
jgi:hypothetical protein